jgi:hypothetical protein
MLGDGVGIALGDDREKLEGEQVLTYLRRMKLRSALT